MTLRAALASAISRLTAANVPSPRLNAELLLMFTLACDRAYLHAHPERKLSAEEQRRYDMPDERPRVLDWTNREDRNTPAGEAQFDEDDIPF